VTITLQPLSSSLSLVEKAEPVVQVRFTLRLREGPTEGECECMQDNINVKVYMDPYMVSHWSCFMIAWIIFLNQIFEVGLTQNWETVAPQMLTIVYICYFHHV
jgi:hypothetical protein